MGKFNFYCVWSKSRGKLIYGENRGVNGLEVFIRLENRYLIIVKLIMCKGRRLYIIVLGLFSFKCGYGGVWLRWGGNLYEYWS